MRQAKGSDDSHLNQERNSEPLLNDSRQRQRPEVNIFWFRRDLRLKDNHGLSKALRGSYPVVPLFVFDRNILDSCAPDDGRVSFIHEQISQIKEELKSWGGDLKVHYGTAEQAIKELQQEFDVKHLICNRDYEPYALTRDLAIKRLCEEHNIGFHQFKDQVIFEMDEIVKDDGKPYVVYTPYSKKWLKALETNPLTEYPVEKHKANLPPGDLGAMPTLEYMGFKPSAHRVLPYDYSPVMAQNYQGQRNFPGLTKGTSKLSPHLRFGSVSVRQIVRALLPIEDITLLKELIWREFFMQILWHFPHTVTKSFKPQYDRISWRNDPKEFEAWKNGQTGYPLVDAGMRELNTTGYMHNRVRMLVASFLCKHLLIDWRWGEAYFAEKLLDYECSSNVGNWQWAAGSGVDAAPYFRIFNPMTQVDKFDKQKTYIKRWVPECDLPRYTKPVVEHKMARTRCLETYKAALNEVV
jgi:deoxyribodipyrimidine photo-lyase